jgi:hypothetical protein
MKIHKTKNDAEEACKEYVKRIYDLQEELGVKEEDADSCVSTSIKALYYSHDGLILSYYL